MTMSKTLITVSTDGQKKQYDRFIEDASDKAFLQAGLDKDKDGLQRLIGRGGEFQSSIIATIKELSVSNRYADEEVSSNYTYPPEYKGPKPIIDQITTLAKIFNLKPDSAIDYSETVPSLESFVPADALAWTGWFAWIDYIELGRQYFPKEKNLAVLYCLGVNLVLEKIKESRPFYNHREGEIIESKLRLSSRTADAENVMRQTQKGPILIGAAQLGMRHGNPIARSVRRARELFVPNEFGLGSLAVGSIALTHPERFVRYEELDVDCAGDEFDFGDGRFFGAPCVYFFSDKVYFLAYEISYAGSGCGAASAFLPQ
ncbi:hypothetical protein ACFL23_01615 [Patescibacteria group bacterium]